MEIISILDFKTCLISFGLGVISFILFNIYLYTPLGLNLLNYLNKNITRGIFILFLSLFGTMALSEVILLNIEIDKREYTIIKKEIDYDCANSNFIDIDNIKRSEYNKYFHCKNMNNLKDTYQKFSSLFKK